jgi:Flp pilus assembly protein TadG
MGMKQLGKSVPPGASSSKMNGGVHRSPGLSGRLRTLLGSMRDDRGVTLIEFALIMIPFFVIIFGILELGFVFWGTYELENATEDAARLIRTGQIKGNSGAAAFKAQVCNRVAILTRCNEDLRLDVRSFRSFAEIQGSPAEPLDRDGNLQNNFTFSPGGPRSIVLVSTFYRWPLINAITSFTLSNMAGGDRLLRASAAFRNEPFPE